MEEVGLSSPFERAEDTRFLLLLVPPPSSAELSAEYSSEGTNMLLLASIELNNSVRKEPGGSDGLTNNGVGWEVSSVASSGGDVLAMGRRGRRMMMRIAIISNMEGSERRHDCFHVSVC